MQCALYLKNGKTLEGPFSDTSIRVFDNVTVAAPPLLLLLFGRIAADVERRNNTLANASTQKHFTIFFLLALCFFPPLLSPTLNRSADEMKIGKKEGEMGGYGGKRVSRMNTDYLI